MILGAAVSVAEGLITDVSVRTYPEAGPLIGPCHTSMLTAWNVQVNRAPEDGLVKGTPCAPGGYAFAYGRSAAENESTWICCRANRHEFVVRQVACKVVRRDVCGVNAGERVQRGQGLGLIGSALRTDRYLPERSGLLVREGGKVWDGSSVVAMNPGPVSGCPK